MANRGYFYPAGEILNISYNECAERGLIGFYEC